MDYAKLIGENRLAAINLENTPDGIRITWPDNANIFGMTVGKFLDADHRDNTAMIYETLDGDVHSWTFADIDQRSTNLAHALRERGYGKGDFIGIHAGLHPDTAVAHMAVCKINGIAVTLSQLYGPESLAHSIGDCEMKAIITSAEGWDKLRPERKALYPSLQHVLMRNPGPDEDDLGEIIENDVEGFEPDFGGAQDPALLMYTSGSTGKPKGILHGHRVLASYTPTLHLFFNLQMEDEDAVYWSPADWAWVGGLLDLLLPAWIVGKPVVTSLHRFSADWAYEFMCRHKVTHTFFPPTAIKRLAQTKNPREKYKGLDVRAISTGGEALAAETLVWAEEDLGAACNEFFGMTEVNHLIGNCKSIYPHVPGSMGVVYPGHKILLVDEDGNEVPTGEVGEIVTPIDAPSRFLGYYKAPDKEQEMILNGKYLRTRDMASCDESGYYWYKGRNDDLIKSSGFRIGPAEIEESLIAHASVAEAAAVAKPDPDRGSIVKAFIKLAKGIEPSDELKKELTEHVRNRLAPYKAPRDIEFVDAFAMTTTGKISRRTLREQEQAKAGLDNN